MCTFIGLQRGRQWNGLLHKRSHQNAAEASLEYNWFIFDISLVNFDGRRQKLFWIFLDSSVQVCSY